MQNVLEQGPDFLALVQYNSVFVPLCLPNTCKDVFNPNVTTFQSNCAEGLHFSAFYSYCYYTIIIIIIIIVIIIIITIVIIITITIVIIIIIIITIVIIIIIILLL